MAELTEQQIAEYDSINTTFENASTDLAKFESLLNDAQTQLDALISEGYKNPEERKVMQINDVVYFKVKNLSDDIIAFRLKKETYESQVNAAKELGYKNPTERIAAEAIINAEKKAAKLAAEAVVNPNEVSVE